MGSPSVSTHRGLVHWQGLLLVVSLLNFWNQPTTAQLTVEPTIALERTDVTLYIRNKPPNTEGFLWYRGVATHSDYNIAYRLVNPTIHLSGPPGGQAIVKDDGSLMLKNVTMKDAGIYTVLVHLRDCQKLIAYGRLHIYPLLSMPTLQVSNTTVTENKDAVVFTCYTNAHGIQWFFNGTSLILNDRTKLSRDRKNLTIDPVLREDAGDYQCRAYNFMNSAKSASLVLDVKSE